MLCKRSPVLDQYILSITNLITIIQLFALVVACFGVYSERGREIVVCNSAARALREDINYLKYLQSF